jgi:hypothetical protein
VENCCDPFANTCDGGKCCVPEGGECLKSKECCGGTCVAQPEGGKKCGCVPSGEPCPRGCRANQPCAGCCGDGICASDRHCFGF